MREVFSALLILCSSATALFASASELDVTDFAKLALQQSDAARDLRDTLLDRSLDLDLAEHQFTTQWVPVARLAVSDGASTQALGMEARRQSTFGPELAVGVTAERRSAATSGQLDSNAVNGYVRISQGLFRGWGERYNRASLTRVELNEQRERMQAQRRRQDIILSAVQTWYNAALSALLIEKSGQALERAQRNVELALARQSVGLVSKVDVYRAELAALTAESALQDQLRTHQRSLEALYEMVGQAPDGRLAPTTELAVVVPLMPEHWEREILDLRADWMAHRIDVELSDLGIYLAQRETLPDLRLVYEASRGGAGPSPGAAMRDARSEWAVRLELRSQFDMTRERAALTRETLNQGRLMRRQDALERQIRREAREAFEDLRAEERRQTIAQARLAQAQGALELSHFRFERGLSDNLDVIDAELAYSEAELDVVRARVAYNLAGVRWAHGVGVLDLDWLRLSVGAKPPEPLRQQTEEGS